MTCNMWKQKFPIINCKQQYYLTFQYSFDDEVDDDNYDADNDVDDDDGGDHDNDDSDEDGDFDDNTFSVYLNYVLS